MGFLIFKLIITMKETFYFPHDNNAHSDPRLMSVLMEVGLSGIGLYWILIEIMHQQRDGYITKEQFTYYIKWYSLNEKNPALVEQLLNTYLTNELFSVTKDNKIYSNRVLKNKEFRDDLSKKRSEAGKKSAEKRAKQKQNPTSVEQNPTSVEQGKERKGKERKRKETDFEICFDDFQEYRKQINKPLTDGGLKLILDELSSITKNKQEKIKILEQSIRNGWAGVFPVKKNENKNNIVQTQTKQLIGKM